MKTRINKTIQIVLFIMNILIVTVLLAGSAVMIYFSTSEQKAIFGRTALLYSSFNDDNIEAHSLYIIDTTQKDIAVGDEIAFMALNNDWESVPCVDTIENITNGIIQFVHSPLIIEQDKLECIGKIDSKHPKLGEGIYSFVQSKSAMTAYVAIGGGFIVCSLIVVLLFAVKTRHDALINAEKRFETVGDIDEIVYENDHQPLTVTDDEDSYDDKVSTLELPNMTLQTHEIEIVLGGQEPVKRQPLQQITLKIQAKTEQAPKLSPTNTGVIDNLEDQPKTPRSQEIDMYLDEIIKQAQEDFDRIYGIK